MSVAARLIGLLFAVSLLACSGSAFLVAPGTIKEPPRMAPAAWGEWYRQNAEVVSITLGHGKADLTASQKGETYTLEQATLVQSDQRLSATFMHQGSCVSLSIPDTIDSGSLQFNRIQLGRTGSAVFKVSPAQSIAHLTIYECDVPANNFQI